jgi:intracellular septation protein
MTSPEKQSSPNGLKMALEYGPLILFFVVNSFYGIYYGTAVLVVATVITLSISWVKTRTIPKILAFGCAAVVFFGALTLIFQDETFIKIKPTVVSLLIAAGLALGQMIGRNPLKAILGDQMQLQLPDAAWRRLTGLWVLMFVTIALANEIAWRILSTDGWVTFKVFGLTGISLGFGVLIAVYLSRHQKPSDSSDD